MACSMVKTAAKVQIVKLFLQDRLNKVTVETFTETAERRLLDAKVFTRLSGYKARFDYAVCIANGPL